MVKSLLNSTIEYFSSDVEATVTALVRSEGLYLPHIQEALIRRVLEGDLPSNWNNFLNLYDRLLSDEIRSILIKIWLQYQTWSPTWIRVGEIIQYPVGQLISQRVRLDNYEEDSIQLWNFLPQYRHDIEKSLLNQLKEIPVYVAVMFIPRGTIGGNDRYLDISYSDNSLAYIGEGLISSNYESVEVGKSFSHVPSQSLMIHMKLSYPDNLKVWLSLIKKQHRKKQIFVSVKNQMLILEGPDYFFTGHTGMVNTPLINPTIVVDSTLQWIR
jgi:hypothetical protein